MPFLSWTTLAWIFGPIALWLLLCAGISFAAGWTKLAKRFRAHEKTGGQTFWFQFAFLNSAQYKGCLNVSVSPHGLGLSVLFPFRFAHPPLLIPWEHLSAFRTRQMFWKTTVYETTVKLGKFDSVKIEFADASLARAMKTYMDEVPTASSN